MRPDHDIVIVGGGPAGIATALFLAHARPSIAKRLVVLEKEQYPREKYCAGGLGGRAEMALARIGVSVDVPSAPVSGISLALPDATLVARDRHIGRVVRRIEFDAELAAVAKRRGIRVVEGAKVGAIEVDPDGVSLRTSVGDLRTRIVVGADGVGSVVRKSLGLGVGTWRAQVLEVDTDETDRDTPRDLLHFDVLDQDFTGYEWDFPTIVRGQPLVCRGVYHLILPGERGTDVDLNQRMARRLERFGLDLARCKKKRFAERGFAPHEPAARPRALLVGEAAGVDPITGEGIAQAILYGDVAAPYLLSRLDANALTFEDWPSTLYRTRLGLDMLARHALCRRFFGPSRRFYEKSFAETPEGLEIGVSYFGGRRVDRRKAFAVFRSVVSHLWQSRDEAPLRALPMPAGS